MIVIFYFNEKNYRNDTSTFGENVYQKKSKINQWKPLVSYIIESAIKSKVFDEIYINSESEEFKYIVDMYGIKFYKRPSHLSSDTATNDEFVQDFIENVRL